MSSIDKLFENIEFIRYDRFFHAFYVKGLHEILHSKKQLIIDWYKQHQDAAQEAQVANVPLPENDFYYALDGFLYKIAKYYYVTDRNRWERDHISIYYQDKKENISVLHNHQKNSAGLVMTTYIDPPSIDEGGELQIYNPPHLDKKFKVEKDYIYSFPSWLLHRPLPQLSSTPRICLNWGLNSSRRPVNKITGDIW